MSTPGNVPSWLLGHAEVINIAATEIELISKSVDVYASTTWSFHKPKATRDNGLLIYSLSYIYGIELS